MLPEACPKPGAVWWASADNHKANLFGRAVTAGLIEAVIQRSVQAVVRALLLSVYLGTSSGHRRPATASSSRLFLRSCWTCGRQLIGAGLLI